MGVGPWTLERVKPWADNGQKPTVANGNLCSLVLAASTRTQLHQLAPQPPTILLAGVSTTATVLTNTAESSCIKSSHIQHTHTS